MPGSNILARGACYRIGQMHSCLKYTREGCDPVVMEKDIYSCKVAINEIIALLTDKNMGVIPNVFAIDAFACHVSHGGEQFGDSVIVQSHIFDEMRNYIENSRLEDEPGLELIEVLRRSFSIIPIVAVFGLNVTHKYAVQRAAQMLDTPVEGLKLLSCCLGMKSSVLAMKHGKPFNIFENAKGDRPVLYHNGHDDAQTYSCFEIKKHMGSFMALMEGVDAIIFTGVENDHVLHMRKSILTGMEYTGIRINWEKNRNVSGDSILSIPGTKAAVLVIPSEDETAMAKDTHDLLERVYENITIS